MPQEIINLGIGPSTATGDNLNEGGRKINDNFTELYETVDDHEVRIFEIEENGGGGGGTALPPFDSNRPITQSNFNALSGKVLSGENLVEFIDTVFFPKQNATISFSRTPASGERGFIRTVTFNGSASANDDVLTGLFIKDGGVTVASAAEPFTSVSYSLDLENTRSLALELNREGSANITGSTSYVAYDPFFVGPLTLADISSVMGAIDAIPQETLVMLNLSKRVEGRANRTFSFNLENNRACFIYLKSHGPLSKITDQNGFNLTSGFESFEFMYQRPNGEQVPYLFYYNTLDGTTAPSEPFAYTFNF